MLIGMTNPPLGRKSSGFNPKKKAKTGHGSRTMLTEHGKSPPNRIFERANYDAGVNTIAFEQNKGKC